MITHELSSHLSDTQTTCPIGLRVDAQMHLVATEEKERLNYSTVVNVQ